MIFMLIVPFRRAAMSSAAMASAPSQVLLHDGLIGVRRRLNHFLPPGARLGKKVGGNVDDFVLRAERLVVEDDRPHLNQIDGPSGNRPRVRSGSGWERGGPPSRSIIV